MIKLMLLRGIKKILKASIKDDFLSYLRWELTSIFRRAFSQGQLSVEKDCYNVLNLGCGNVYYDGIINADFFSVTKKDFGMDLRYPFKIKSETFDGIFCDHTLEHLSYEEVEHVLDESYRILKPGGWIRVIVPDFNLFVTKYYENDNEWFNKWKTLVLGHESRKGMERFFTKIFALNFTANFYHHKTLWNYEMAQLLFLEAGFSNVESVRFREGQSGLFFDKDTEDRRFVSLYLEAQKL